MSAIIFSMLLKFDFPLQESKPLSSLPKFNKQPQSTTSKQQKAQF